MNTQSIGSVLFGQYRRQALGLLLLHPEESLHIREIARLTKTPAGTMRRELSLLAEVGILTRKPIGNQVHYQANPQCPIYEELRGIMRKTVGVVDALREALLPRADRIALAFVYGSIANGRETATSDIDVMVIGDISFLDAVKALHPLQEVMRREVNPKIYGKGEFVRKLAEEDPFLTNVMAEPKLMVLGEQDDLAKLASNRAATAV